MGDLERINKTIRKALYRGGCYIKTLATERLYLKPGKLGVGLMNVRMEWTKELIRVWKTLKNTNEEATRRIIEEFAPRGEEGSENDAGERGD